MLFVYISVAPVLKEATFINIDRIIGGKNVHSMECRYAKKKQFYRIVRKLPTGINPYRLREKQGMLAQTFYEDVFIAPGEKANYFKLIFLK